MWRGLAVLVGCAAGLLMVWSTTGFEQELPDKGFVLRLEEPATAADRDVHRFLRNWQIADFVLADLNAYVDLPHRVMVVARSCAGEGTAYDPSERRIDLCYEDLVEEREAFERAESWLQDEDLADLTRETLYHEAGHALRDALDLPDAGARAEEDAADRFAQLMLLRGHPEGEDTLLTAARAYDLAAAADPTPDPADEHAPPATRAESHRCAVHGDAAPTRHRNLATPARAHCAGTWAATREAWTRDLTPLLRR
ncbi:DUF4344 domain-containing metallopeptidase [Streptomyces sp. NBC_01351]|uniref:DUF4344 domain-containing metallopeptidase n=1 Tax=Streptomyces sp. NBC_01351 TaxID=2903833 RepID=UPI002E311DBF|nr:DUF4344 domain-containing metallopeptidase [Streptomyces sp. NBC_01351]